MPTRCVSFRSQLKGEISDFLQRERMVCSHTEEGLLELVVALSHYTEEGRSLYPELIICDNLELALGILRGSDRVPVGRGPRSSETVLLALKRCATLAVAGWLVYVQRCSQDFDYGVFRTPTSPIALDARETLYALSQEASDIPMILASQLAEKAVELIGARSGALRIHLSAIPDDSSSPFDVLKALVGACTKRVAPEISEQTESFLRTSLGNALRRCHGTLVGVVNSIEDARNVSTDGVLFETQKSLCGLVREHESQRSDETFARLLAHSQLLAGMLNTDGMVLLSPGADLVGYNLFVQGGGESETIEEGGVPGGARRRAFNEMRRLVDENRLEGCFIQSSDGTIEFYPGSSSQ